MCGCDSESCEIHVHHESCGCIDGRAGRFTEPYLLLVLAEGPSHGYDLASRLGAFRFPEGSPDPATIYRNLRQMEEDGLVKSRWETSGPGPARRLYELTAEGEELLHAWVAHIRGRRDALDQFLTQYEARFSDRAEHSDEGR